MTAPTFQPKEYQNAALDRFRSYLRDSNSDGANIAFYKATNLPYRAAPIIAEGTPYICLRVPTGGGKTIMAAHAIGIAAQEFMQITNPMVLWLVPSTPILEQTGDMVVIQPTGFPIAVVILNLISLSGPFNQAITKGAAPQRTVGGFEQGGK